MLETSETSNRIAPQLSTKSSELIVFVSAVLAAMVRAGEKRTGTRSLCRIELKALGAKPVPMVCIA